MLARVIRCPNGATCRIFDDYIGTEEENARRKHDLWQTALKFAAARQEEIERMKSDEAETRTDGRT